MYPNETAEHHRDHRCRNKEVNQFCYDPISKYRGNFCGCITRHHPVWAGSRSWVSRHLSLHLSIRGDEVRVRSCLIFRYRIWPKKQCILEKHSNLLQKYNSCRLLLTITHKYLSSHETRKHRHIIARVAAFWQRVFQTLPILDVHPGVAVYHTLKIFSIVNAKDLLMPHTKFQVCTLKINTIFCHRKKKSHYFWTGVCNSSHKIFTQFPTLTLRSPLLLCSLQYCKRKSRGRSTWWHHMETFSALLARCAGNSPVTGELPAQRPVMRSFDVFFWSAPV